jgi:hypothetical protein
LFCYVGGTYRYRNGLGWDGIARMGITLATSITGHILVPGHA